MPTCFSKCEECVYLDILPMEHPINGIYFNDFKLNEALIVLLNYHMESRHLLLNCLKTIISVVIVLENYAQYIEIVV